MAKLSLLRVDSRLIHGQVVTGWVKVTQAKKILIIDDWSANDILSAQIYTMAAPPGVSVEVMSVNDAVEAWNKDQFGKIGPILILFRDIKSACQAYEQGLKYEKLQIGGIPNGPGRVTVEGTIALNKDDAILLESLSKANVNITFQLTTDTKSKNWASVKSKFFSKI